MPKIRKGSVSTRDNKMKEKIHPKYFTDASVTCSCGNKFTTGSTRQTLRVELCNKCHPYFTGEQKIIDTAGRVERFNKKYKREKKPE
jgi:large subunit ribosomal protein L31